MTKSDPKTVDSNMETVDRVLMEAAQGDPAQPSADFMARILQDALSEQPMPHLQGVRDPWWHQMGTMIGGWRGMGGLITATCAGFWIGFSPSGELPVQIDAFIGLETSVVQNDDSVNSDALIGFGWDVEEG